MNVSPSAHTRKYSMNKYNISCDAAEEQGPPSCYFCSHYKVTLIGGERVLFCNVFPRERRLLAKLERNMANYWVITAGNCDRFDDVT